jgi:hypothetical protein
MKFTKMSLVAALLIGSSAFAIENTKVSGDAKLFYGSADTGTLDLLQKDASAGQAALDLGLTTDLTSGISAGVATTALTTLGLENNLVSAVWAGQSTQTQWWVSEAWMAATVGNTTAKIGRQKLDTPLAFTETWNIAENTFDAAVLINTDLPDTTLVGAWVGKGNGTAGSVVVSPVDAFGAQTDSYKTFAVQGAYAAAVVNNSFKPLTAQAWYYDVVNAANAFWLQADVAMEGVSVGVQYASIATTGVLNGADDSSAMAAKLGYTMEDMGLSASVAFSQTDKKGTIDISNVATGHTAGSQSKLYTEAWWNYGYVGAADMTAFNVTVEYALKDIADFGLYYTNVANGDEVAASRDMSEITLTASKSFGPLDTSLVYINCKADDQNAAEAYNTVQAYLTLNF